MKHRVLLLLLTFLLLTPSVAVAQPNVCGFYGTVSWDDELVGPGVEVQALVSYEVIDSTFTNNDSEYSLKVACDNCLGKTVDFAMQIGDEMVLVAYDDWIAGDNIRFDIDHVWHGDPCERESMELRPTNGVLTNVIGKCFNENRPIEITYDGDLFSTTATEYWGNFAFPLIPPTNIPGTYTITASDDMGGTYSSVFEFTGVQGPFGEQGPEGQPGEQGSVGPQGQKGKSSSTTMSIVGLIASIAALIAVLVLGLRGHISKREADKDISSGESLDEEDTGDQDSD